MRNIDRLEAIECDGTGYVCVQIRRPDQEEEIIEAKVIGRKSEYILLINQAVRRGRWVPRLVVCDDQKILDNMSRFPLLSEVRPTNADLFRDEDVLRSATRIASGTPAPIVIKRG